MERTPQFQARTQTEAAPDGLLHVGNQPTDNRLIHRRVDNSPRPPAITSHDPIITDHNKALDRSNHNRVAAQAATLIADSMSAGLSIGGLFGTSRAWNSPPVRQEPCAARQLCDLTHLTSRWRGLVCWLKTRSAPRRIGSPIAGRLSPDLRAGRCALAIDECSDDDDQRLTIRTSQRQGQRVAVFFLVRFQEVLP